MTTEDEFQSLLDASPEDYQTRLVFADWLQERNDPRAEGYRALGSLRRKPDGMRPDRNPRAMSFYTSPKAMKSHDERTNSFDSVLVDDWYNLLEVCKTTTQSDQSQWKYFPNRREAEDAAALAFTQLPVKRRAELLAGQAEVGRKPTRAKPKKKLAKPKKSAKGKRKK